LIAFALVIASVVARPVAAGTERTEFTAHNIVCEILDPGVLWVDEDGIQHLRDRVLRSVVISDNEYHNGTGVNFSNFNFDPITGVMTYFGTLEIYPAAFEDNYWAGSWSLQIVPSRASGIARLQGYGEDLNGLSIKSNLTPLTPAQLADFAYACGGNQPIAGVRSEATMLNPGDK
jgi:hypothetical protein